jgi:hypothetical protein
MVKGRRESFYASLQHWLKPNEMLILEAFLPRQLQYQSGGPEHLYNRTLPFGQLL